MVYWVRVSYYDDESDTEEYETLDEAVSAFSDALDMDHDCVLGDVSRISYGKRDADGKSTRLGYRDFD
jgi:hypothetical protein